MLKTAEELVKGIHEAINPTTVTDMDIQCAVGRAIDQCGGSFLIDQTGCGHNVQTFRMFLDSMGSDASMTISQMDADRWGDSENNKMYVSPKALKSFFELVDGLKSRYEAIRKVEAELKAEHGIK